MFAVRVRSFLYYLILLSSIAAVSYRLLYVPTNYLQQGVSLILYPFIKLQQVVCQPIVSYVKKKKEMDLIQKQSTVLKEENEQLRSENIALQATLHYYNHAQEVINFKSKYTVQYARFAQIIMKHFSAYEHSYLIDCGSAHGVTVDMIAVYKNCLVGRVTHVYPYYSKVKLITDPECKVAAYCLSSQAHGIHEGVNKKKQSMLQYVSHLHTLKNDDLVISSGEGLVFPQGFGIGTIKSFELQGLHYNVVIKPLLKFADLQYCYVIQKGAE